MNTHIIEEAYRAVKSAGANEDDLHDAIIEILPRAPTIYNLHGYLSCVTFRQRQKRAEKSGYAGSLGTLTNTPAATPAPSAGLLFDELRNAVTQKLAALPARERAATEMRLFDELPAREISRRLDISSGAVRNRLFRARKRLAHSLDSWRPTGSCHAGDTRASHSPP